MYQVFAKSAMGFKHEKSHKPCQDHSLAYQDVDRTIITCCDGHGGDIYVRSQLGSKFASLALFSTFSNLTSSFLRKYSEKEVEERIKLQVLCEWNRYVEQSLSKSRLKKSEIKGLTEKQLDSLRANPARAYGTTLTGALVLNNKLIVVSIGDSECLLVRKGELIKVFNTDDDPVGNVTYSMCEEDAYKHMRVRIVDFRKYDGVVLCTDGFSGPYQSYDNLHVSMIRPLFRNLSLGQGHHYADAKVSTLAKEKGIGDDVTLSYISNHHICGRYYK